MTSVIDINNNNVVNDMIEACPSHAAYFVPNWVPEEWKTSVTQCVTDHKTVKTMSDDVRTTLNRFVMTTKTEYDAREGVTWEGVYNLAMTCLKYPSLEECYEQHVSEDKATAIINSKFRIDILRTNPGISDALLDQMLEKVYFQLVWKIKLTHLERLRDVALASNVTLKVALAVDMEMRRRIESSYDIEGMSISVPSKGLKYLFFLYANENVTRGRWMLVAHDCPACCAPCDWRTVDYVATCGKCGSALRCDHCDATHVDCK